MRVIGGACRGRPLRAPTGDRTRPTSDRVREAIFDVLGSVLGPRGWQGCSVVDLFAGTGALGIEALSRGAPSAWFVEQDPGAVHIVRSNLSALGFSGSTATVVPSEVLAWLSRTGSDHPFDVAFCDPPYAFDRWDDIWSSLQARMVVTESSRPVSVPSPWVVTRRKRYGSTLVMVAKCPPACSSPSSSGPSCTKTGGSGTGSTERGVD